MIPGRKKILVADSNLDNLSSAYYYILNKTTTHGDSRKLINELNAFNLKMILSAQNEEEFKYFIQEYINQMPSWILILDQGNLTTYFILSTERKLKKPRDVKVPPSFYLQNINTRRKIAPRIINF